MFQQELFCCKLVNNRNCLNLPTVQCTNTYNYFCTIHSRDVEYPIYSNPLLEMERNRRASIRRAIARFGPNYTEEQLFDIYFNEYFMVSLSRILTRIRNESEEGDERYISYLKRVRKEESERNRALEKVYRENENRIGGNECCICICFISETDEYKCDICEKSFHKLCIRTWKTMSIFCPICRSVV